MEKAVELRGVSKKFGKSIIYESIDLEIRRGEIAGFVGENGCGKSVLFQIITGLLPADSGRVTVQGEILGEKIDFPENTGAMINSPGFIGYYSGYRNLKLLAEIRNTASDRDICDAMEMVGLDPGDRTPVRKYSTGLKQKLGIAQSFMEGQSLILLDEPFNALDFRTNREVFEIIEKLKRDGKTIMLTSHQHEYLEKLCDRIYCVHEKKIVPFTDDLRQKYFSIQE